MEKTFNHQEFESKIYEEWEKAGAFKPTDTGEPFTILMPPPNANASLHAGHAMYTVDDIILRYKRMKGFSAFWIPGRDHAGFETQYVYEKHLANQGKSRMDFDRTTLYNNVYEFVQENSGLIFKQFRRLGFSADWDRAVFTLDPHVIKQVFETFQKMEKEGYVYRDKYIVNYCVNCGTSLAELEVKHVERVDPLYYIDYPATNGAGKITVATVRPETLFGDTAVAVNPKDERYKNLGFEIVRVPLTNRDIPVIFDEGVDMEFGTGAVKITPAHDPADFDMGKKHNLETISVIDLRGKMNMPADATLNDIQGVKANKARETIIAELQNQGLINKIDSSYVHSVVTCYKCGRDLEPTIIPNWFIKVDELKKAVIEVVEQEKVKFYPKRFKRHMLSWLTTMHDWPISRQIVWGIRIPVWYEINDGTKKLITVTFLDKDKKAHHSRLDEALDQGFTLNEIEEGLQSLITDPQVKYLIASEKPNSGYTYLPETDTFDTWFSSGQWPLVTLKENEFARRFPTDFIGTLSDILKFWISRMILFSLYLKQEIPFKDVYLWSMVADSKGIKMSKSKGNVINPIDLIDKYGADALRFSLIFGAGAGGKVILAEEKVKGMRNFGNKVWNVARFVLAAKSDKPETENPDDSWIKEEFAKTKETVTKSLETYQLNTAAETIYEFIWHVFADQYIEKIKDRREEAYPTMVKILRDSLKLLHPFMPFVTEAIWSFATMQDKSNFDSPLIITSSWPS